MRSGSSRQAPPQGAPVSGSDRRPRELTLRLLERILPDRRAFAVRLWDGTTLPATDGEARAVLVLREPDALGRMLRLPLDLHMGEAYLEGACDVEGDPEVLVEMVEGSRARLSPLDWAATVREAAALRRRRGATLDLGASLRGRLHSRARDRQAIAYHYDLSNRFYSRWLDRRMIYSCGYFPAGSETLDEAQEAKLEHICRKLRLEPGERLLDVGCGWGGLAIYAAERHRVEVLGVTLSERQHEEATARVRRAGLEDRVRIELLDYRDVEGRFAKIVSVGMAEHVGAKNMPGYFRRAFALLEPGGLMLNHAISRGPLGDPADDRVMSGEFSRRYIFPDGEILPLHQSLAAAEEVGFEVRDVEDLREHYATTLRHWRRNLEAAWDEVTTDVGVARARVWRLYLAGSARRFAAGRLAVHQALLAKPDEAGRVDLPASRADLYLPSTDPMEA